jgi:hypothetical protein
MASRVAQFGGVLLVALAAGGRDRAFGFSRSIRSARGRAGCARRMEADVSAVADPATGVAVYQPYGGSGWSVYGGTSAASPIVASVWALAGAPNAGDQAAQYPYNHTGSFNDVTSGRNGSCSPADFCTAQAGYDGPTG